MENYIKLASTTEAMRAKNILLKHGIKSRIKRIPSKHTGGNCTFGIEIYNNFEYSIEILEKYHIYPLGQAYGDNDDIFR